MRGRNRRRGRKRPDGMRRAGEVIEHEPEILRSQRGAEPADQAGLDMAQRELSVMEGRLADKSEIVRMWEDIAQASGFDDGFGAKQVQVMAGVVKACRR